MLTLAFAAGYFWPVTLFIGLVLASIWAVSAFARAISRKLPKKPVPPVAYEAPVTNLHWEKTLREIRARAG